LFKQIVLFLVFISTLFASNSDFLKPDEAFRVNIFENKQFITIDLNLDKTIYVYDDKLKILLNKQNITKDVLKDKAVHYHDYIVHTGNIKITIPKSYIKSKVKNEYKITLQYQGCSKKGLCYAPMQKTYQGFLINKIKHKKKQDETSSISDILKNGNFFVILITFFGFGLLLSLTPCIFPMIPILSSIIVQHSNKNKGKISTLKGFMLSLIYVLSMSVAYTLAGIFAGLFGANIQAMLQNPYVLVSFSTIFVALAFSLFGYYSLELPQSFTNKINAISGKNNKGYLGVAIMGFLSALIVGPCVAPPLAGALMYIGQTGDAFLGGIALFVMSLGLGMPLLIVGLGASKFMPKPGGWMDTVSKIFGVVMLALAIYMLDRILDQYIIFILYALLSIGSSIYLLKQNSKLAKIIAFGLIIVGIYFGYISTKTKTQYIKFTYIKNINQLNHILKTSKKPVMLDFWASWCVSCKELEDITYASKDVQKLLSQYTLLKVDVTNNTNEDKKLMQKFHIFGPPALVFWNQNNKTLEPSQTIVGYKPPKELLKLIK